MKVFTKRTLTSIVYVLVMLALCLLKWVVPGVMINGNNQFLGSLGFDALFCAIAVIASMEFVDAVNYSSDKNGDKMRVSPVQKVFTVAFCALIVPLYVAIEVFMPSEGFLACVCAFAVYAAFIAGTSVFDHGNSTVKGAICCIFIMLYCGVLTALFSAINHLPRNSMLAIISLIFCTMFTDAGAYLVGKSLKRFVPLKLAPKLSPNKTVIGAVGGLIGGVLGGLLAYVLIMCFGGMEGGEAWLVSFNSGVFFTFTSTAIHPIVSIILVSLVTAVMVQIGDLFESAIKRECGIKDMGKLLPGHGGVLDRFDGMLCCGIIILFCFGTIII